MNNEHVFNASIAVFEITAESDPLFAEIIHATFEQRAAGDRPIALCGEFIRSNA